MAACGSPHPDRPELHCESKEPNHFEHRVWIGPGDWVCWPNLDYIEPAQGESAAGSMYDIVKRAKRERRASRIPRGSRIPDDPAERMAGAERAGQALEPEFLEAALEGGRYLSRRLRRWTVDDLWEWLDENGYRTLHAKAMTSIIHKLVKDGVIVPVPKTDPDCERLPRNSNSSRKLAVYESQIFEDEDEDTVLLDFG